MSVNRSKSSVYTKINILNYTFARNVFTSVVILGCRIFMRKRTSSPVNANETKRNYNTRNLFLFSDYFRLIYKRGVYFCFVIY